MTYADNTGNADALIGQQLGNYLVQNPLGRGGMARVYRGIDLGLKRIVAIKVVAENLRASSSYAQRFEREAQSVANLKHPNIVTVFHFGNQSGLYYLVMEYVDGADLDALMRQYEAEGELMPHADAVRILQAIASALDYAHRQGVIHRDVKPSNIMLERDGRPVLTDFGLALRVSEGTVGDTFGSPHYIAPEQARSSANAGPQSDIYSLGIVAYELLTGALPFDDVSVTAVAMQHIMSPVPSPRAFNHDLSQQVEDVLLKALAKEPGDRYDSAEAFVGSLKQALDALRLHPVKVTTAELPPLPAGVAPPPPHRVSIHSARDVLEQELAQQAAQQGQQAAIPTLESRPDPAVSTAQPFPTVKTRRSVPQRSKLPYALGAVLLLGVLGIGGFLASGGLNSVPPVPTVASLPTGTTSSLPSATAIPPTKAAVAATQVPTRTRTFTPTPLPTKAPTTAVPTALPTTAVPTAIPPTATPLPPTATPTNTPVPAPAQATGQLPTGKKFVLIWDETNFMASNQSGERVLIASAAFERVQTNGLFAEHFEAKRWAAYYPYSEANKCMLLKVGTVFFFSKPDCPFGYNATINALSGEAFWTPSDNSVEFRILWNKKEVGRCQIAQKRCEVWFPA